MGLGDPPHESIVGNQPAPSFSETSARTVTPKPDGQRRNLGNLRRSFDRFESVVGVTRECFDTAERLLGEVGEGAETEHDCNDSVEGSG